MTKAAFFVLLLSSLCLPPVLALIGAPPPTGDGPRLVLFPPWTDGWAVVRAAGGAPVGPQSAPLGILAYAADNVGFDQRLQDAGAWAVIDGRAIARLCGVTGKAG